MNIPPHDAKLQWSTYEYNHREKSGDWYWVVGIISVALVVISLLFNDIIFAVFLTVAAFTLMLFASRPPRMLNYEINDEGVIVGPYLYTYTTLESFWIDEIIGDSKIIIKSKKLFMPYIIVPIGYLVPDDIRILLLAHLPEKEHHEPLMHKIMERFGF